MKLEFSRYIFEKDEISNVMKTSPAGAGIFHVDGRTDRNDEANIRFSQFCEKSLKQVILCIC
jgi:hypothetical protein